MKLKNIIGALIVILPLFIGYYAISLGHTYYHESAHVAIYKSYGLDAKYKVNILDLSGYTYATNYTLADKVCGIGSSCSLLHDQNEIVGYNIAIMIDTIFFVGGLIYTMLFIIIIIFSNILYKLNLLTKDV